MALLAPSGENADRTHCQCLKGRVTEFGHNVRHARRKHPHVAGQADQARSDFALIEANLEIIMGQLARVPTRAYACRIALMTAGSIWALIAAGVLLWAGAFWHA